MLDDESSCFGPQVKHAITMNADWIWYACGARQCRTSDSKRSSDSDTESSPTGAAASQEQFSVSDEKDGENEDDGDDASRSSSAPPACILWASIGPIPALPLARAVQTGNRPRISRANQRIQDKCTIGESYPLGLRPAVLISSDGADGSSGGATTLLRHVGSSEASGGTDFPAGLERSLLPLGVVVPPARAVTAGRSTQSTQLIVPNTITLTLYHCWHEPPARAEVLRGGDEPGSLHRRGYDVGHGLRGDEYDDLDADDEEVHVRPPARHVVEAGSFPETVLPSVG